MRVLLALCLLASACHREPETRSAFAAASGVTRATASRAPHIVPLRMPAGDVEILTGDPDKAGEPFVMRIHELPGTKIPLHSHPVDENITVVQGTWYFAVSDTWDRARLTALHSGDYAFAPKESTMFGWCPDGAIVQVHGIGPFQIHWHHGLKTLDEPGSTFTFRKGETVETPRGRGTIRQGYASGDIIQYEMALVNGTIVMVDQTEVRR
jgi:quercetin dioxygenase-like cupin family protein